MATDISEQAVNALRILSAEMVEKANSGHPGMPMGMAPIAYVLWRHFHRFAPQQPKWPGRDRFVLSNGHGSALQYALLHLAGYNLPMEQLKLFRQKGSMTPGHPEVGITDGVEVTTGPLGQGIANAVGLAFAESHLAAIYNRPGFPLFDNYTYVFCGDGCLQEGITHEAASLAGHWGLNKLIVCYDDNKITIDGHTKLSFTEDVLTRYKAYGWNTMRVKNANSDLNAIHSAIAAARQSDRPTIIAFETTIGFGAPNQGSHDVHGAPLGKKNMAEAKKKLGLNPAQSFFVPQQVYAEYAEGAKRGIAEEAKWRQMFEAYSAQFPKEAAELRRRLAGDLPENIMKVLPRFSPKDKPDATRNHSLRALTAVASVMPELVGGSADLAPSNKTFYKGAISYQKNCRKGRYVHFGIREHAMFAIGNGMHAYGGLLPFTATFLAFIEYGFGAIRLSALAHHQHLYIATHDSIYVGEDGATHQPISTLSLCRATPNIQTLRPADGNETSGAYLAALLNKRGPSVLALTRHNLPSLPGSSIEKTLKGAYVIDEVAASGKPDIIIVATGSEVITAIGAANILRKQGKKVRVVSMPCMELFDKQPLEYRRSLLTPGVPVISVECLGVTGWEKYCHHAIGMHTFGMSAPAEVCADHFGFTPVKVAATINSFLKKARTEAKKLNVTFPSLLPTHLCQGCRMECKL